MSAKRHALVSPCNLKKKDPLTVISVAISAAVAGSATGTRAIVNFTCTIISLIFPIVNSVQESRTVSVRCVPLPRSRLILNTSFLLSCFHVCLLESWNESSAKPGSLPFVIISFSFFFFFCYLSLSFSLSLSSYIFSLFTVATVLAFIEVFDRALKSRS